MSTTQLCSGYLHMNIFVPARGVACVTSHGPLAPGSEIPGGNGHLPSGLSATGSPGAAIGHVTMSVRKMRDRHADLAYVVHALRTACRLPSAADGGEQ